MAQPAASESRLATAEHGSLVIADVSGYTTYLLGTELEHAQDVLADLMGVVVDRLEPPLTVSKLEGDAVFAYALDGVCGASTLLDSVEQAYFAFRERLRDIAHATACTCEACRQIPTLDLKFIVHHGSFVRRGFAGVEELTGRDVIVVHRLAKNTAAEVLGTKGYVLLTQACVDALGLDPGALGMVAHAETYEDVGEIVCCLDDLAERWEAEEERQRVYIRAGEGVFERTLELPLAPVAAWDWLTSPARRSEWDADTLDVVTPGGRQQPGVTNHCVHGPDVIIEHVLDWRPFDYFTTSIELPGLGELQMTTELEPAGDETTVHLRGEPLDGERLLAWQEVSDYLLEAIDASIASLQRHVAAALDGAAPDETR